MNSELSELVEGVLMEAERIGLARTSIKYYRSCCGAVVRFCRTRGIDRLTEQAVEKFLAAMVIDRAEGRSVPRSGRRWRRRPG